MSVIPSFLILSWRSPVKNQKWIFAFVNYASLLRTRYTKRFCAILACPKEHKSQANFVGCLLLANKPKWITTELLANLIADIWHGSRVSDVYFFCFRLFLSLYSSTKKKTGRSVNRAFSFNEIDIRTLSSDRVTCFTPLSFLFFPCLLQSVYKLISLLR